MKMLMREDGNENVKLLTANIFQSGDVRKSFVMLRTKIQSDTFFFKKTCLFTSHFYDLRLSNKMYRLK